MQNLNSVQDILVKKGQDTEATCGGLVYQQHRVLKLSKA